MADAVDLVTGQAPLKGVVLCCTALSQDARTSLADIAGQMGADHKLDLTSDVTHLIIGSSTTPKYKYVAKDRPDIKVLQPQWIEAVRSSWMEGGEVDVEALEQEHRFPAFSGLQICVTGFTDPVQRDFISTTVEEHGARYHGDLIKAVTHLITAVPEGAKYVHARQWGIHTVSLKWFEDSLKRGMSLDETFYDPTLPAEEQGKGAFRQRPKQRISLGKHEREEVQRGGGDELGRKKLRRTMSSKLDGHSQDMWSEMSGQTTKVELPNVDQWNEDDHTITQRAKPDPRPKAESKPGMDTYLSKPGVERNEQSNGLFAEHHILIHGFNERQRSQITQVLGQNGAVIEHSLSMLEEASRRMEKKQHYVLVPHACSSGSLVEISPNICLASEWWVERCLYHKRILDPGEDPLSQPLLDALIPGFENMSISTTGFAGVDLRQVAEAVKLMGGSYQETTRPTSSVLISNSAAIRKEKAYYAQKYSIPVVSADWLWDCLNKKVTVPFQAYQVELPILELKDLTGEPSTSSPVPSEMLRKKASNSTSGKDEQPPKRLSSVRRRHTTPSLPLQATKAGDTTATARLGPFIHDDQDDSTLVDFDSTSIPPAEAISRPDSRPLREISPNLSPRKASNDSAGSERTLNDGMEVDKSASPAPLPNKAEALAPENAQQAEQVESQPQSRPQHELAADLAEIVSRQNISRPSSVAPTEPPQRRKSRPLGRASSAISNRSTSFPLSTSADSQIETASFSDFPESVSHSHSVEAPRPPSTQLGYETHDAEAHRLQMSKKMGTKLQEEHSGLGMKRVASVGHVKDSGLFVAEAGVGNRVKGRKGR